MEPEEEVKEKVKEREGRWGVWGLGDQRNKQ